MSSRLDPVADARLLRAARRYEALAGDQTFLWVMDAQLRPTGPNAAWEAYTGQARDEYLELGWLDAVRAADRDRCLEAIQRNVPLERPFALEVALRRHDGAYRRHFVRATPVRDEHGATVEWIGTAIDVEAERLAADQLRAAEERLWLTHDAAGVGTWEWFPATGELRWSPQMYHLLGLEPAALVPSLEAWVSAIHPDDVASATGVWVQALEGAGAAVQDFRIVRRDGSVRWITSRASVTRNDSGDPVRVFGVNLDITERRLIEERMAAALAEHQELRSRLVALTDGAEAVLRPRTPAGVRAAICELAARVLPADGYAIWNLDSGSVWEIVHSIGLGADFVSHRLPGGEVTFVAPLVADTLELDELAGRAEAYRSEGIESLISVPLPIGGVRRGTLVAYFRSPHQSTQAERQVAVALGHLAAAALGSVETLARQEQMRTEAERHSRRMAFLAEASTVLGGLDLEASFSRLAELAVPALGDWCAIDVERDGRLHRIAVAHPDPAMLLRAQEVYDRYPVDMNQPHGAVHVLRTGRSEFHPVISDEQVVQAARDSEHLDLLRALGLRGAIIVPLTARGRTLGVLTLVTSTPDRRYDESDLRFVEDLASRAALAFDNARLYEEAQRANRVKDEFLALLSHELRTPLNAIMGWAQVLLNPLNTGEDVPARRRALEIIQRNARLQAELVNGLLDVTRIATGGLPLARQSLNLDEAAAAATEAIRPVAAERGLTLTLVIDAPGARVFADPTRVQQILSNLLSNAVKFTPAGGGIQVTVRGDERWGEFEVSDTGDGIAPEFLSHVFDRFRQADSSTTRRHGGLGLGLWLVRELVTAHGGMVDATSGGPGLGAAFTVRLPASDPAVG